LKLTVHQLGSGSSGNLTAVAGPEGVLLVDAGFPAREVQRRLALVGLGAGDVRALVLTHAHLDHSRGAALLSRRLRIPLWATPWTLKNLRGLKGGETLHAFPESAPAHLAGLAVETCPVSHDVPGTVILRIAGLLGVATDLGVVTPEGSAFLTGLSGLLLEFNHDEELLRGGPYPVWLQDRILSDQGHLANAQAAELLRSRAFAPPSRALWLAHMSAHNNRPERALAAAAAALGSQGPELLLAEQDAPTGPIALCS